MSLVRKQTLYQFVTIGWWIAVAVPVILVGSGNAEPYASPSLIPYGPPGAFGSIFVLGLAGTFVVSRLRIRSWKRMGRRAGLTPAGGGLLGKPDLTGTVDGRSVTASTYSVKESSGGEGGSSSVTYTLVETDLRDPTTDGYVVGTGSVAAFDDDIPEQTRTQSVDGEHHVIGDVSAEDAGAVVSHRVREAFEGADGVDAVVVGDPTQAIMGALPDELDGFVGSMMASGIESALADKESFAAGTAAHDAKGLLLDPAELEARATAVAAVVDAHEHAGVDATTTQQSAE
jgi:hypothetical protein